ARPTRCGLRAADRSRRDDPRPRRRTEGAARAPADRPDRLRRRARRLARRRGGAVSGVLLAGDGGNAKTDLALVAADGTVLALVRGPGCSPHEHGVEGALDRIGALLIEAGADGAVAHAELLLAGVDFPAEVEALQRRAEERGWAERVEVANDTFAVLRAGTERGWGVAVVCGAGINCLGLGPDGRQVRFPALGQITGAWCGGQDVVAAGVGDASRSSGSARSTSPRTSCSAAA